MPRGVKDSRGRKTALTPQVESTILHVVGKGNHITTACAVAGVTTHSLYRWIRRGDAVEQAIETGQPYDRNELRFRDFRDGLLNARAKAAMRAVDVIDRAMIGGFVIEEEPVVDAEGKVQYDQHGEVIMKRRFSQPDGRLALSYLAKAQPEQWGNAPTRLELITGGGEGGAAEGEQGPSEQGIAALAARLARTMEARQVEEEERLALEAAGAGEESDEVFDGELVEEGDAG